MLLTSQMQTLCGNRTAAAGRVSTPARYAVDLPDIRESCTGLEATYSPCCQTLTTEQSDEANGRIDFTQSGGLLESLSYEDAD